MPQRAPKPCGKCGKPATHKGLCKRHAKQTDTHRGNAHSRGYNAEHETRFRQGVLTRAHYQCALCQSRATVADHYPRTRKQLLAAGLDANHPQYGRALCATCHNRHTASTSIARRDA